MNGQTTGRTLCTNRTIALLWRAALVVACVGGLLPLFSPPTASGQTLCYFTTQTNLMVAAQALLLLVGTAAQLWRKDPRGPTFSLPPILQSGVVFCIQITFLVFAFMLSGSMFSMGTSLGIANLLLHYVVPLMALFDWLLFLPHGRLRYRDAALWLSYPAAYVVFAFVRADLGQPFFSGSRFPYFFMDADKLGWNLCWICPLFFAAYFGLGCLLVWVDRRLGARKQPNSGLQNARK